MGLIGGMNMQHIPVRGAASALTTLIVGDIEVLMDNLPTALPQIRGAAVVALAVTSARRMPDLPNIPALGEHGTESSLSAHASASRS